MSSWSEFKLIIPLSSRWSQCIPAKACIGYAEPGLLLESMSTQRALRNRSMDQQKATMKTEARSRCI
jgi:hypothetical protein